MKTDWYLTRATGSVALVLLTLVLAFGVAQIGRLGSVRCPRFALDDLHRFLSLLAIAFLAIHILTAVLDSFAPIALIDAVVPFVGVYRPLWLGLGAVAFDLLLAVAITSVVRARLGHRAWRAVHWAAYAAWPIALTHALGTGSDVRQGWFGAVGYGCGVVVALAVIARLAIGWPRAAPRRLLAAGTLLGFSLAILVWLPGGPLARDWAQRAGTPARLLPHASVTRSGP